MAATPPPRLTSVTHMAINPLVMMAAQNRGEPVPTALINTADKRRHRVAIDGVEGFDQQLYADLDSESSMRFSEGSVWLLDAANPGTRMQRAGLLIKGTLQTAFKKERARRQSLARLGWTERWFVLVPNALRLKLNKLGEESALQEAGGGVIGKRRYTTMEEEQLLKYDALYIFHDQQARNMISSKPILVVINQHVVDCLDRSRRTFDIVSETGEKMSCRCHSTIQAKAWGDILRNSIVHAAMVGARDAAAAEKAKRAKARKKVAAQRVSLAAEKSAALSVPPPPISLPFFLNGTAVALEFGEQQLRCIHSESGAEALSFSYFDVQSWRAGVPDDEDVDSPSLARRDANKHNTAWSALGFPALVLTVNPAPVVSRRGTSRGDMVTARQTDSVEPIHFTFEAHDETSSSAACEAIDAHIMYLVHAKDPTASGREESKRADPTATGGHGLALQTIAEGDVAHDIVRDDHLARHRTSVHSLKSAVRVIAAASAFRRKRGVAATTGAGQGAGQGEDAGEDAGEGEAGADDFDSDEFDFEVSDDDNGGFGEGVDAEDEAHHASVRERAASLHKHRHVHKHRHTRNSGRFEFATSVTDLGASRRFSMHGGGFSGVVTAARRASVSSAGTASASLAVSAAERGGAGATSEGGTAPLLTALCLGALPAGWVELTAEDSSSYYFHKKSSTSSWVRPSEAGWLTQADPATKREYYFNAELGRTQWDDPCVVDHSGAAHVAAAAEAKEVLWAAGTSLFHHSMDHPTLKSAGRSVIAAHRDSWVRRRQSSARAAAAAAKAAAAKKEAAAGEAQRARALVEIEAIPIVLALASDGQLLPNGWTEGTTMAGKLYYFCSETKQSRWTPPGVALQMKSLARLTPRQRQEKLRAIFDDADKNGDGVLLPLEFAKSIRASSAVKLAKSLYQQLKLFAAVDSTGSGRISFDEFENALLNGLDDEAVLLWLSDSADRIDARIDAASTAAAAASGAVGGTEEDDALSSSSSSDSEAEEEEGSLPPGWVEQLSAEYSRIYYSNTITGASSWERPTL